MMSGFTVEYSPAYRLRRRIRYEPHDDVGGYRRITEEWDGDRWCVERRETITDRDTSACPHLAVNNECSDTLSEPRSEQAGVERTP
jgi:hypothetical protein